MGGGLGGTGTIDSLLPGTLCKGLAATAADVLGACPMAGPMAIAACPQDTFLGTALPLQNSWL